MVFQYFVLLVAAGCATACLVCLGTVIASERRIAAQLKACDDARRLAVTATDRVVVVEDSLESLRTTLNRLDSRTRMREVRQKGARGELESPDWERDPDDYIVRHSQPLAARSAAK